MSRAGIPVDFAKRHPASSLPVRQQETSAMPPRVLVVDDDDGARTGLQELLEAAGYETVAAATFQDGRRALHESAPDLLIADVRLGEFNGLQLVAAAPRRIPTIVITGFLDPVLEAEARSFGADFLLKPVSPSALLAMVDKKLAELRRAASNTVRRWPRKPIHTSLPARIADLKARILDVSYGGLRFEIESDPEVAMLASFNVSVAPDLAVPVDLVWTSRTGDRSWLCGAAVSYANQAAARAWCGLVDATA
jgi:FixJ family two-component response regulator